MTIGEKISARRKELKLTLEDIGKAVGVGKSTVKKWESGFIANMKRDKIAALAKILQISPAELIGSDSEECTNNNQTNEFSSLSENECSVIENMRKLNSDGENELVHYSKYLTEQLRFKKESDATSTEAS